VTNCSDTQHHSVRTLFIFNASSKLNLIWSYTGKKDKFIYGQQNKILILKLLLISGIESNPGPSPEGTHLLNREKCCAVCFLKAYRVINENQEKLIKQHVSSEYDKNNLCLPIGICKTCHMTLHGRPEAITKFPDYKSLFQDKNLTRARGSKEACTCLSCKVALAGGLQYMKLKKDILQKTIKGQKGRCSFHLPHYKVIIRSVRVMGALGGPVRYH
jgi:ferredoxin